MKSLVTLIIALAITAGSAFANCGIKDTNTGKLTAYDQETKSITVMAADGTSATLTLTPNTEAKDAMGKAAKVEDLLGQNVEVVSEHAKVDSVTAKSA